MSAVERSASLWLDQAVGHHVEGDLTAAEAGALTAKIKSYVGVTWVLIAEAHARRAHKALGYATWADYVEAEFDISRSRSYQLISQARVVLEISEAVSTTVDISEREARDLEPMLAEAKQAAVEAAEALPDDATPEDKSAAVSDALDRLRQSAVEAKRPKATHTHTTTETSTVTFDAETGEIVGGGDGRNDSTPPGQDESPKNADPAHTSPEGESQVPPVNAPSDSPSVPPVDPVLGYRATASRFKAQVRSSLLTLDPERVIETSDDPKAWADLAEDLAIFAHKIHQALAGPKLKAVK